jgi:CheY-like chemotaxis protein
MAKILVIDDDIEFLEMLQLLLQRGEHEAVLSADGEDGLAKALADPPDLAIVDVMMPDITGYDICRRLRADPSTASIPILILTARGQPVDRQAALDAGADDHLGKPVTMAELLERVDALLAERAETTKGLLLGSVVFLSLRGGVGVTTLAVNLAAMLAQVAQGTTCLVDMSSSSGHVALQLGLRPEPNWSGLLQAGESGLEVGKYLLQHNSGLHVLASSIFPTMPGQGLSQTAAQMMLSALRRRFGVVVIDAPSLLDEATLTMLEAATAVGLVVAADPASVQTAVGTLRALQQWLDKFYIVLNQVVPGPQASVEAITRTLKRPVIGSVPFDPSQAQALAQRVPLALQTPDSPLVDAIKGMAAKLVHVASGSSL